MQSVWKTTVTEAKILRPRMSLEWNTICLFVELYFRYCASNDKWLHKARYTQRNREMSWLTTVSAAFWGRPVRAERGFIPFLTVWIEFSWLISMLPLNLWKLLEWKPENFCAATNYQHQNSTISDPHSPTVRTNRISSFFAKIYAWTSNDTPHTFSCA